MSPPRGLPPEAERILDGYLGQLRSAGVSPDDLSLAEEFLIPDSPNPNEAELLLDIKAAWNLVREVMKRKGAKL